LRRLWLFCSVFRSVSARSFDRAAKKSSTPTAECVPLPRKKKENQTKQPTEEKFGVHLSIAVFCFFVWTDSRFSTPHPISFAGD